MDLEAQALRGIVMVNKVAIEGREGRRACALTKASVTDVGRPIFMEKEGPNVRVRMHGTKWQIGIGCFRA